MSEVKLISSDNHKDICIYHVDIPPNATTTVTDIAIQNPTDSDDGDRNEEYSISITEMVPPKIEGNIDYIRSQLPQLPNGTRKKNERRELMIVPPPAPKPEPELS